VQFAFELPADLVAVLVGSDEHVCGERRKAGGGLPHVQVVHFGDAVTAGERLADGADVDALGCGLEEDASGGFQQA
jgi:hypothetical protein